LNGGLNTYGYVAGNPVNYVDLDGLDLSPTQKAAIVKAAQNWVKADVPYLWGGDTKKGADCSGSISSIYKEGGVDIGRITSHSIRHSKFFGRVYGKPEVGDIGSYKHHVVLFSGKFNGPKRNVWSAHHTGGPSFGPANSSWFGNGRPTWYRYKHFPLGDFPDLPNSG